MRSRLAVLLVACGLSACAENVVEAPKPAEKDTQFVLERSMTTMGGTPVYVIRDKVNGKLIYVTPGAGVDVEDDN